METIKLIQLHNKRTGTMFNLKEADGPVKNSAKEVEMNIKFDSKEAGFSFQLNTKDMQILAESMLKFAKDMEVDSRWNNKR